MSFALALTLAGVIAMPFLHGTSKAWGGAGLAVMGALYIAGAFPGGRTRLSAAYGLYFLSSAAYMVISPLRNISPWWSISLLGLILVSVGWMVHVTAKAMTLEAIKGNGV